MPGLDIVAFGADGLIPAIAQEESTNQVLMLAYMNRESLEKTIETGKAHYFSRSRQCLWLKGETSGNLQLVKDIRYDCDGDTILLIVEQVGGAACHTGHKSCFYRRLDASEGSVLEPEHTYNRNILNKLTELILHRRENPKEGSYTNYLFREGIDKMLKKVGEEAAEVIIASKNGSRDEITYETADLMYHLSVTLAQSGLSWDDVFNELARRYK